MHCRLALFFALALSSLVQGAETPLPKQGDSHPFDPSCRLVWQEEFDGTKLDRKKWVAVDDPAIGQYGHGNGEAQAYLDAEGDTFFVKDVTLLVPSTPCVKTPTASSSTISTIRISSRPS